MTNLAIKRPNTRYAMMSAEVFYLRAFAKKLREIVARLLASRRIGMNAHASSLTSVRPGVVVLIVAFKAVEDVRCALEDAEREVRGIARCELMQERLTGFGTAVVIIFASDENADRRVYEIAKLGTWRMVVKPTNRIKGHGSSQVFSGAKHRVTVPTGHHEQRLYSAHGTAQEADAIGIDFRT
jgi:hypothetical protein